MKANGRLRQVLFFDEADAEFDTSAVKEAPLVDAVVWDAEVSHIGPLSVVNIGLLLKFEMVARHWF